MSIQSSAGNTADTPASQAPAGAHILIVAAGPETSRFLRASLSPEYQTTSVDDVSEGLQRALALLPDLILYDHTLPGSSAQFLHGLRGYAELASVPAMMLVNRPSDALAAMRSADAREFLVMPCSAEELGVRVSALLARAEAQESARPDDLNVREVMELRSNDKRFRSLMDSNIIGILLSDESGSMLGANDAFLSMIDYSREELLSGAVKWRAITPTEFLPMDEQALKEVQTVGRTGPYEKAYVRRDGVRVPILIGISLVERTPVMTFVCFILDLTQLRAAEAALRKVNDELEVRVGERTLALQGANKKLGNIVAVLEAATDFVSSADMNGHLVYMNRAGRRVVGIEPNADVSHLEITSFYDPEAQALIREQAIPVALREGVWSGEVDLIGHDGQEVPVSLLVLAHRVPDGSATFISSIARDIGDRKRAEAERLRLQEEIIRAQAATLAELSTPLIPIHSHMLVMPLIGSIDSRRTQQIMQTLLSGITEHRARVAILDITGVSGVDEEVANAFIRAAQAVRLLGAQVVLTGIRPEVAQTLVGLGADLSGIVTRSNLQSGIAYGMSTL